MRQDKGIKSIMIFSQSGCLLPLLIFLNLLFGWIFFKFTTWLLIEVILILLFVINSYFLVRKISAVSKKSDNVVDVEGEVIKDKKEIE